MRQKNGLKRLDGASLNESGAAPDMHIVSPDGF